MPTVLYRLTPLGKNYERKSERKLFATQITEGTTETEAEISLSQVTAICGFNSCLPIQKVTTRNIAVLCDAVTERGTY